METKPEEIVEYLNLGNLVERMPKKTGGKAFLVPVLFIEKIRNKWNKMKENLQNFVGSNSISEKIQSKEEKIDNKIDNWKEYRKEVRKDLREAISNDNSKEISNASAALSYSRKKIEELKQKKIKIDKKGLGVFALSALAIKKVASDKFYKIKDKIDSFKEERVARRRAKEEDKVIKAFNKSRTEKTSLKENDSVRKLLEQILEEIKHSNELQKQILSKLNSLEYNQGIGEKTTYTK